MEYLEQTPSLDDAVAITAEGFARPITPVLIEDVRRHLADAQFCLSIRSRGELIGYMLLSEPIAGVLYIGGTLLRRPYQGTGIKAEATIRIMAKRPHLQWFSGRTQSPIVWSSVSRIGRDVLPASNGEMVHPEAHARLGELARALRMDGPIHRGFYGGALYGQKPTHHDPAVQRWWDSICNFERGDAVLYIARLR